MSEDIRKHSGSKYLRRIFSCINAASIEIDVYDVLEAFGNPPAPVAHAIKKLLCAGIRDKGTRLQDLKEARDAIVREIQIEERKNPKRTDASDSYYPDKPIAVFHGTNIPKFPEMTEVPNAMSFVKNHKIGSGGMYCSVCKKSTRTIMIGKIIECVPAEDEPGDIEITRGSPK